MENKLIVYDKKTGKVTRKDVSCLSPNSIGEAVDLFTNKSGTHIYQMIRVKFRDLSENYVIGKKRIEK